jgi:flagellar hook-length control protein FliK
MSDLEATGLRAQSAAPITAVAAGKLRAISGIQPLFAGSEGLVDAFAEVFARMAASSTEPIDSPVRTSEPQDEPIVPDQPAPGSDAGPRSAPEPKPRTDNAVADPGQPSREVQQVDEAEQPVLVENLADGDGAHDLEVNREAEVSQQSVVADVEFEQVDAVETEIDTPQVVAPEVVQSDGREHSRRHRRESTSDRPIDHATGGDRKVDRPLPAEETHAVGEQPGYVEEQFVTQGVEDGQTTSTRGIRGRPRYTRQTTENQPSPVSQTHPAGTQHRAQQANGTPLSSELIAGQSGHSDAAPSPATTRAIESQIADVKVAQASANRSGQTAARVQSGARGFSQAIESRAASPNAESTRPRSPRLDSNTQETVSRIKLIQRVSKAFQHLGSEGGVVRLRLAPAEMGSVRVEMRIHQRKVQARVVAETEAASKALKEYLPDLRVRLESFGMQVDRIEIETDSQDRDQQSHFGDQSHGHDQQQGQGRSGQRLHRPDAEAGKSVSPIVSQATIASPAQAASSGVDVRL